MEASSVATDHGISGVSFSNVRRESIRASTAGQPAGKQAETGAKQSEFV